MGLEPTISTLKGWWRNQFAYDHIYLSGRRGSNSQHTAWKAVTLPLSYFRIVYLWRDLNPHALAPDPKSGVSAIPPHRHFFIRAKDGTRTHNSVTLPLSYFRLAEEVGFEPTQPFGRLISSQLQYHYAIPPKTKIKTLRLHVFMVSLS